MKHIAKRRIKNTAQMLAVLGLVGMSTFGMNAYAQDSQEGKSPTSMRSHNNGVFKNKGIKTEHKGAYNANKQAIEQALTTNNYTAFKTATASFSKFKKMPEVTEAMFVKMVEAYKLKQSGDKEGAQKIMTELGFKKLPGMHVLNKVKANFTDAQKTTLKDAKVLRDAGKIDEAKMLLEKAGITMPAKQNHNKKTTQ